MKKTLLFLALMSSVSPALAYEEWSATEFPPYVEEVGLYELIDTWRKTDSGIFEDQLLEVETLNIDLNGDGAKDTIFLATFGHEDQEVFQKIEIWLTFDCNLIQIYENSDAGTPYNKIVNLDGNPYIRTSYSDTVTWINWEALSQPWYLANKAVTDNPNWESLMQGY